MNYVAVQLAQALVAAARLLRANLAVTHNGLAVAKRDERHAAAVEQVVIEYHSRQAD